MEIRETRKEDCREIQKLIQELADFENLSDGPKLNYEVLERDGFETDPPLFKGFVAVDNGKIIGQALYYYTYSSWEGKSMFLEELYVTPEHRNKGIGGKLFDTIAETAANGNCCRLEFTVVEWNPAQEMYKKKGAVDLTKSDPLHRYRLSGDALKKYRTSV